MVVWVSEAQPTIVRPLAVGRASLTHCTSISRNNKKGATGPRSGRVAPGETGEHSFPRSSIYCMGELNTSRRNLLSTRYHALRGNAVLDAPRRRVRPWDARVQPALSPDFRTARSHPKWPRSGPDGIPTQDRGNECRALPATENLEKLVPIEEPDRMIWGNPTCKTTGAFINEPQPATSNTHLVPERA